MSQYFKGKAIEVKVHKQQDKLEMIKKIKKTMGQAFQKNLNSSQQSIDIS